ncbi:MAG: DUF4087 domain-containing protein [Candidatus Methylumidiphilus sp.]
MNIYRLRWLTVKMICNPKINVKVCLLALFFLCNNNTAFAVPTIELRCGWFENSSPNNASLTDKDGEWTIAMQGGHIAKGDWPRFKKNQWIKTGVGSYGYGCACMKVTVNPESEEVVEIFQADSKPLSSCRQDKHLKEPTQ